MTVAPEHPPSAPPVLEVRQRNVVFGTIVLGMLLAALDQTIVGTALPTIVADLGGAAHMSWVVTAYLPAETVATVLAGRFGDLYGRKLLFQISAIVFVGGSFLCGLATDMTLLIAWRAVQGLGAGGLMVTAMALIADGRPRPHRRPQADPARGAGAGLRPDGHRGLPRPRRRAPRPHRGRHPRGPGPRPRLVLLRFTIGTSAGQAPVDGFTQVEQTLAQQGGYQRIDLRADTYQGNPGAYWEFTYGPDHVGAQTFVTADGTQYTISLSVPEADWTADQAVLTTALNTFTIP